MSFISAENAIQLENAKRLQEGHARFMKRIRNDYRLDERTFDPKTGLEITSEKVEKPKSQIFEEINTKNFA